MYSKTVILADGRFPSTSVPLKYLNHSKHIVCCDGAVAGLLRYGLKPSAIVGDMDSLDGAIKERYKDIVFPIPDQDSNDLTKAVNFCVDKGLEEVVILGATGFREDHAIGNIALLQAYAKKIKVKMVTNHGVFSPISTDTVFESFPRQQISIFSMDPEVELDSENLQYPLAGVKLDTWWKGTLNQCDGQWFKIKLLKGEMVIVFQTHLPKKEVI